MRPIVSVITPAFNSASYIVATIESVLGQTLREWEMIIVDDNSQDQTYYVALEYASADGRIRPFRLNSSSGPATARNVAIEKAAGRYIAFLDSDDLWRPEKLEIQVRFMQNTNSPFSHSYYETMSEDGSRVGKIIKSPEHLEYKDLLKCNRIGCLTAMYDTDVLGKQYMPLIQKRQDYALWLNILKITPIASCVPVSLAYYRVRSSSLSSRKIGLVRYNWKLFREYEKLSLLSSAYYLGWNILNKILSK